MFQIFIFGFAADDVLEEVILAVLFRCVAFVFVFVNPTCTLVLTNDLRQQALTNVVKFVRRQAAVLRTGIHFALARRERQQDVVNETEVFQTIKGDGTCGFAIERGRECIGILRVFKFLASKVFCVLSFCVFFIQLFKNFIFQVFEILVDERLTKGRRKFYVVVVEQGCFFGLFNLTSVALYKVVALQVCQEVVVRSLTGCRRRAVDGFVFAAVATKVSTRVYVVVQVAFAVYGIVFFLLRFYAVRQGLRRCVIVHFFFNLNVVLFQAIQGIVKGFTKAVNGVVVIFVRRAAVRKEVFQGKNFGVSFKKLLFRLLVCLFFRAVREFINFRLQSCKRFRCILLAVFSGDTIRRAFLKVVRNCVLNHNFAAYKFVHQKVERIFIAVTIVLYVLIAVAKEVSDKFALGNFRRQALKDTADICTYRFVVLIFCQGLGDVHLCNRLRQILFVIGKDEVTTRCPDGKRHA